MPPGDAAAGASVFGRACAPCHGVSADARASRQAFVANSSMIFLGLRSEQDRANVAAYLQTLH